MIDAGVYLIRPRTGAAENLKRERGILSGQVPHFQDMGVFTENRGPRNQEKRFDQDELF